MNHSLLPRDGEEDISQEGYIGTLSTESFQEDKGTPDVAVYRAQISG